jgi:sec-independent protein translocase protein TatA
MNFGWQELLIILGIVVIIFGGARIAGVGKASGRAIREFKDELKGPDTPQAPTAINPVSSEPVGLIAEHAPTPDATPPEQADTR